MIDAVANGALKFGWHGDTFVVGQRRYGGAGYADTAHPYPLLGPVPGGSVEGWSAAATPLLSANCEAFTLALLSSFAAPLMSLFAPLHRGCVFSLTGPPASEGLALVAAASAWGKPEGLTVPLTEMLFRGSRLRHFERINHLPVLIEAMSLRDPLNIRNIVTDYVLGPRHCGIMIATSPVSVIKGSFRERWDLMVCEVRLVSPPSIAKRIDRIRYELATNAGHAGDLYASYLVIPATRPAVMERLTDYATEFSRKVLAEYRSRVLWAAAVMTAAELVNRIELMEIDLDRVRTMVAGPRGPLRAKKAGAPLLPPRSAPSGSPAHPSGSARASVPRQPALGS
jgi:hypothetical protein